MFSKIEIFLANLSFVILFITMFYYWYQLSVGFQVERRSYDQAQSLITVDGTIASTTSESQPIQSSRVRSVANTRQRKTIQSPFSNRTIPNIAILTSFSSLLVLLILRWKEFGHFPLSNLYESLIFLSLSCLLIHFLTQNYFLLKKAKVQQLFQIYLVPLLLLVPYVLMLSRAFCLPDEMQQGSALVPALQSNWLMMHVTVMITSYGALIVGSLFSIAYLVIDTILKKRSGAQSTTQLPSSRQSSQIAEPAFRKLKYTLRESFLTTNLILILDNLSYRIIGLGFPLLTIGILSGAVWANEAWGSYWSWDPKETWALLTWFVFAIYLHTRITRGWEGRKSAIMASFGFITVWICFLGVNLLGEGLHSYGFLSK
uniref:Cytochrome c biogenesis protein CcsA n=1 Tax=Hafniomonas laevis TaxID=436124 RepID=A0A0S2LNW3_9CHLO|nr:heme attachment to plastid cytochrome c [Hafniomonas laevis]ALO63027.1 heme attachment to plastid cytochrome c [Hafniomonas laevis]